MSALKKLADELGSTVMDGTHCTNCYLVIATNEATGSQVGIKPLGFLEFRLRHAPIGNPENDDWQGAASDFDWEKTDDVRQSLVERMVVKLEEECPAPKQSLQKLRLATRMSAIIAEKFEKMDGWKTIDLGMVFQSLVDHWLSMVGDGKDPQSVYDAHLKHIQQLEEALAELNAKTADLKAAAESEEPLEVDAATVIKDLFASEQEAEDQEDASDGGTDASAFGNVEADDDEVV